METPSSNEVTPASKKIVNVSEDGSRAICANENELSIWDLNQTTPALLFRTSDMRGGLKLARFVPQSTLVVLVPRVRPRVACVFDFGTHTEVAFFQMRAAILDVKLNASLIACVQPAHVFVHNLHNGVRVKLLQTAPNPRGLCALCPTKFVLAFPHAAMGRVSVVHAQESLEIQTHDQEVSAMALNPGGDRLATASACGRILRIFHTRNGTCLQQLRRGLRACEVRGLQFHLQRPLVFCFTNRQTVHVFEIVEGKRDLDKAWHEKLVPALLADARSIAKLYLQFEIAGIGACGGLAYVATKNNKICVYSLPAGQLRTSFPLRVS